jgi:hypothetical protein
VRHLPVVLGATDTLEFVRFADGDGYLLARETQDLQNGAVVCQLEPVWVRVCRDAALPEPDVTVGLMIGVLLLWLLR